MEYNSQRGTLKLKEYGRNIQKLVEHALSLEDKKEKQDVIDQIIMIMGNLNPHLKNVEDFNHLLWDHLHIMSDFQFTDIESPYPMPDREVLFAKPEKFAYPTKNRKFRHYGKNIQSMIAKAVAMDDVEKKQGYAEIIANYMKIVYGSWNGETVSDEIIINDLDVISEGKLTLESTTTLAKVKPVKAYGNDSMAKKKSGGKRHSNNNNNRRKNYSKNR